MAGSSGQFRRQNFGPSQSDQLHGIRKSAEGRRSADRERYDADPRVLSDDFSTLELRDNEGEGEKHFARIALTIQDPTRAQAVPFPTPTSSSPRPSRRNPVPSTRSTPSTDSPRPCPRRRSGSP